MWTKHFHPGITNNEMVAVNVRGYFAGTFLNSWHERSYAAGVERSIRRGQLGGSGGYSLGYRLGAINGYDSRLIKGAGATPVVPFLQILANGSYKRVGVQASYCWLVFTGGFFVGGGGGILWICMIFRNTSIAGAPIPNRCEFELAGIAIMVTGSNNK